MALSQKKVTKTRLEQIIPPLRSTDKLCTQRRLQQRVLSGNVKIWSEALFWISPYPSMALAHVCVLGIVLIWLCKVFWGFKGKEKWSTQTFLPLTIKISLLSLGFSLCLSNLPKLIHASLGNIKLCVWEDQPQGHSPHHQDQHSWRVWHRFKQNLWVIEVPPHFSYFLYINYEQKDGEIWFITSLESW